MSSSSRRSLPSIARMLDRPAIRQMIEEEGRAAVLDAVRGAVDAARQAIASCGDVDCSEASLEEEARQRLGGRASGLRRVINATGILLHTGLGRAPLAREAIEAIGATSGGYADLELDLASGERGRRTDVVSRLLRELTGAEACAVVNNNAAATILSLRALAAGREVIVSRGQLVEIGGSFRLPEIMACSGAKLREVGTTNRTRIGDYESAIGPETAAILRVHASNYRVVGFVEEVGIDPLASLARSRGLWMIDDIGSGAIGPGLPPLPYDEPNIADSIKAAADLVLFSGDKLLGGPQCGVLAGRAGAVARVASDPLMRAFRVDKLTIAALETTLRLALDPPRAIERIPLWRALSASLESLTARALTVAQQIRAETGMVASVDVDEAFVGGGSVPMNAIPSAIVRLGGPWPETVGSEGELARRLRVGEPSVVPRVRGGAVILDLRAVEPDDDARLVQAVRRAALV